MGHRELRLGKQGENKAAYLLGSTGYVILERNFRCAFGEVDIIARKAGLLVFVEVKTRTSLAYGMPGEAVDRRKRRHMVKAAQAYRKLHGTFGRECRFDVIEVLWLNGIFYINHIENAFGEGEI